MKLYATLFNKIVLYMKMFSIFARHNFNFFSKCLLWYNLLIALFSGKNSEIREELTGPNIHRKLVSIFERLDS